MKGSCESPKETTQLEVFRCELGVDETLHDSSEQHKISRSLLTYVHTCIFIIL